MLLPRPRGVRAVKQLVLRGLMRACSGFLYIGEHNRRFYEAYGALGEQLFFAPYGVDNAFFAAGARRARADGTREQLRQELGAGADDVVVLAVGKLLDIKRPLDLVRAASRLGDRVVLGFVGAGPMRSAVEDEFRATGVRPKFVDALAMAGIHLPPEMFSNRRGP